MGLFNKKEEGTAVIPKDVTERREIMEINDTMIEKLVLKGDISLMTPKEKVEYYKVFCQNLGLNPATQPFEIINFKGKEILYAKKSATEQLRKTNGVSIYDMRAENIDGKVYKVTAYGIDRHGRKDVSTGVVNIEGMKGENLSNAIMKAETKAKRRLTLSLCGLGIMDESEYMDQSIEDVTPMMPEPLPEPIEPLIMDRTVEAPPVKTQQETKAPVKDTTPSNETAEEIRNEIVKIVNGATWPGAEKSRIIGEAFKAKEDTDALRAIRNNIQKEM